MRPRSLLAVSVLERHIASRTLVTAAVSMSATASLPIVGHAYVANEERHCLRCFTFHQDASCAAMYCSHACSNVIVLTFSAITSLSTRRPRTSTGPIFSVRTGAAMFMVLI